VFNEHLDVLGVADLLARVDVDKNGHRSLFSFALAPKSSLAVPIEHPLTGRKCISTRSPAG
jgi:hypothetical protein